MFSIQGPPYPGEDVQWEPWSAFEAEYALGELHIFAGSGDDKKAWLGVRCFADRWSGTRWFRQGYEENT